MSATTESIEELWNSHSAPLYSFALKLTHDRGRAEEIVQDTFIRAIQHPDSLDGSKGSTRSWLFTVAKNLILDKWRRDTLAREATPRYKDTDTYIDELDQAIDSWIVSEALQKLSSEHREVLYHSVFLGRSVKETSESLDIPQGTVKSRTFYALRSLRLTLDEMGLHR